MNKYKCYKSLLHRNRNSQMFIRQFHSRFNFPSIKWKHKITYIDHLLISVSTLKEILTIEKQYCFETKQRIGVKAFSSYGSITFNELAVSRFSLC